MRRTAAALLALGLGTLAEAGPAAGQVTLVEHHDLRLGIGGYVQTLTGIHDRGFDTPDGPGAPTARTSGFHGQVARLKWSLGSTSWNLQLHQRLQARVASGAGEGPVLGLGVTPVPDRLVDLDTDLVRQPGLHVWHDLDRASLTVYTPAADVTIGRQPITWGTAVLFPVADLWAAFSPFELDTEEKPGVDALRALFYPAEGTEMDIVVADRGAIDDLSIGVRGTRSLPGADLWAGGGKFWRQAILMGGVTLLLDQARLRAEAVLPWDLDGERLQAPRATLGADWIRGTFLLSGEIHFNGIGAPDPEGYGRVLRDERLARGETYYLGRYHVGAAGSWSPDEENRLTLALTALTNLGDGSASLTPAVGYDLGQTTRVSLGGLVSIGEAPELSGGVPTLESEFGTYGELLFTRFSVYF